MYFWVSSHVRGGSPHLRAARKGKEKRRWRIIKYDGGVKLQLQQQLYDLIAVERWQVERVMPGTKSNVSLWSPKSAVITKTYDVDLHALSKGLFSMHLFHGHETRWNRAMKHLEKPWNIMKQSYETPWNSIEQSSETLWITTKKQWNTLKRYETTWNRAIKHHAAAWNRAVKHLQTLRNTVNHTDTKINIRKCFFN